MGVSALKKWEGVVLPPPGPPPSVVSATNVMHGMERPFLITVIKAAMLGMLYLDLSYTARRSTECKLINSKFAKVPD